MKKIIKILLISMVSLLTISLLFGFAGYFYFKSNLLDFEEKIDSDFYFNEIDNEDGLTFFDFNKNGLIDIYEELYSNPNVEILFEGAQGFGLDIDHGDYPYVTSSHCTTAAALLNGVPPQAIRKVWGVAKIYETYVGAKAFQPHDSIFDALQEIGEEFGATTGRKRQCNWTDLDTLIKAVRMNGVTDLVFNKMDVLREVGEWKFYNQGKLVQLESEQQVKSWLTSFFSNSPTVSNVYFSGNKDRI